MTPRRCAVLAVIFALPAYAQPGPPYAVEPLRADRLTTKWTEVQLISQIAGSTLVFDARRPVPSVPERWRLDAASGEMTAFPHPGFPGGESATLGKIVGFRRQRDLGIEFWAQDADTGVVTTLAHVQADLTRPDRYYDIAITARDADRIAISVNDLITWSDTQLWLTDGTPAGTRLLPDDLPNWYGSSFVGDWLILTTQGQTFGTTAAIAYNLATGRRTEIDFGRRYTIDRIEPSSHGTAYFCTYDGVDEIDPTTGTFQRVASFVARNWSYACFLGSRVIVPDPDNHVLAVDLDHPEAEPVVLPIAVNSESLYSNEYQFVTIDRPEGPTAIIVAQRYVPESSFEFWATRGTLESSTLLFSESIAYLPQLRGNGHEAMLTYYSFFDLIRITRLTDGTVAGTRVISFPGTPDGQTLSWDFADSEHLYAIAGQGDLWLADRASPTSFQARQAASFSSESTLGLGSHAVIDHADGWAAVRTGVPQYLLGHADVKDYSLVASGGEPNGVSESVVTPELPPVPGCGECSWLVNRFFDLGPSGPLVAYAASTDVPYIPWGLFVMGDPTRHVPSYLLPLIDDGSGYLQYKSGEGRLFASNSEVVGMYSPAFGEQGRLGLRQWPVDAGWLSPVDGRWIQSALYGLRRFNTSPATWALLRVSDEGPEIIGQGEGNAVVRAARGHALISRSLEQPSSYDLGDLAADGSFRTLVGDLSGKVTDVLEWPEGSVNAGRVVIVIEGGKQLVTIDPDDAQFERPRVVYTSYGSRLAPAVLGDRVLLDDGARVLAVDPATGYAETPPGLPWAMSYDERFSSSARINDDWATATATKVIPAAGSRPALALLQVPRDDGTSDLWITDGISQRWTRSLSSAELPIRLAAEPAVISPGRVLFASHTSGLPENQGPQLFVVNLCAADLNGDGIADASDYGDFVGAFDTGYPNADLDGDGFLDGFDFEAFVDAFERGC